MRDVRRYPSSAMKSSSWPVTAMAVLMLLGSCSAEGAASDRAKRKLLREELGQGFAIGSGDPALALKVDILDGAVASAAPTDADAANVFAQRSEGE